MISIRKEAEIRRLLADGLSIRAVASRTDVGRSLVLEIKKLSKLRSRKIIIPEAKPTGPERLKKPTRCQQCGAKLQTWPCVLCHPVGDGKQREKKADSIRIAEASSAEALELFRIAQDLQGLHNLHLIEHPLFLHLAHRVEKCLNRILP